MTAYIQNKTCQLDAVLEALFQDTATWPQAPPPICLRDACVEVVYTLVRLSCQKQVCVPKLHGSDMMPSRKLTQHAPKMQSLAEFAEASEWIQAVMRCQHLPVLRESTLMSELVVMSLILCACATEWSQSRGAATPSFTASRGPAELATTHPGPF